ncbi:MAG: hypothetical protein R3B99_19375 [Polyangiales bacterium]
MQQDFAAGRFAWSARVSNRLEVVLVGTVRVVFVPVLEGDEVAVGIFDTSEAPFDDHGRGVDQRSRRIAVAAERAHRRGARTVHLASAITACDHELVDARAFDAPPSGRLLVVAGTDAPVLVVLLRPDESHSVEAQSVPVVESKGGGLAVVFDGFLAPMKSRTSADQVESLTEVALACSGSVAERKGGCEVAATRRNVQRNLVGRLAARVDVRRATKASDGFLFDDVGGGGSDGTDRLVVGVETAAEGGENDEGHERGNVESREPETGHGRRVACPNTGSNCRNWSFLVTTRR